MENESIKKIIEFVNDLESRDPLGSDQIMDYAQWAGRLRSLGYETYLDNFFRRFDAQTVNSLLKKRISEGLDDIEEAFGEYLAVEIFTVQDFVCFVNYAPEGTIYQDTKDLLNFWIETAELQSLDEEAAQTLELFLDSYPIDKDDLMDIVAAPVTDQEMSHWADALEPMEAVIEQKSKELESQIHLEKTDDASKGDALSIRITGVDPEEVVKVRQRGVPAIRSKADASVWTFDFETFGTRLNVQENIVVQTFDGARANVPYAAIAPYASIKKTASPSFVRQLTRITLFERSAVTVAAADDKPSDYFEYEVEGTNSTLSIAVDKSNDRVIVNVYQSGKSDNLSDELNGWAFYDCNNSFLSKIQNAFAEFKCSQFDGSVELIDADGTAHCLIVKE